MLFGFGVGGDAFAGLLDPADASVDPLADVGLISGLCLKFRLSLGLGRFGRSCPRLFCSGPGPGRDPSRRSSSMTLCASGIWCPGGRGWLGRPGLACVDRCLALSFESPARLPRRRPRIAATSRLGSRVRGVRVPARSRGGRVPGGPRGRLGAWPRGPGPTHPGRPGRRSARPPARSPRRPRRGSHWRAARRRLPRPARPAVRGPTACLWW